MNKEFQGTYRATATLMIPDTWVQNPNQLDKKLDSINKQLKIIMGVPEEGPDLLTHYRYRRIGD